jgi:predicted metal-dependent hydrolase
VEKKIALMEKSTHTAAMSDESSDPRYTGFFQCFNEQKYFEAHEVLEHLWLRSDGANRDFFKGLIQVAGAFVHLQKHLARPAHPKDGQRLHPAVRLFRIGTARLAAYPPQHLRLDVDSLRRLCENLAAEITCSDFHRNPWQPGSAPKIFLTAP